MAYANKYSTTYCDQFNRTCQVFILQNNYVGGVTELEAQTTPFTTSYDASSDFKFEPIRPSSAEVNLMLGNGVELEELWTADEREFKIEHFCNSQLKWSGFIIPNGFSYNLTGGVYYATLEASDGLSLLESLPFLDDNTGEAYGTTDLTFNTEFSFPFILIATEILRKLDLDLNLWTCVDVYERSMIKTGDRESDPLANAFVDVRTYINDSQRKDIPYWHDIGEVWNCKQVLENLLLIFNAKCYQSNGTWKIKRVNADVNYGTGPTQRYWRKYNTLAVYLSKEIINDEKIIPCHSIEDAMIENDHTLSMDDVYNAFRVNYEFQLRRIGDVPANLIKSDWTQSWTNTYAPRLWARFTNDGLIPKIRQSVTPVPEGGGPRNEGILWATEWGTDDSAPSSVLTSGTSPKRGLRYSSKISVNKGDKLFLEAWHLFKYVINDSVAYYPIFKIVLQTEERNKFFFLKNEVANEVFYQWEETNSEANTDFAYYSAFPSPQFQPSTNGNYKWYNIARPIQEVPQNGLLTFELYGLAASQSTRIEQNFLRFPVYQNINNQNARSYFYGLLESQVNSIEKLKSTKIFLGIIRDPNSTAEAQDYIFNNPNANYSLQVEPITVYNGDTDNPDHLSIITVPTNITGDQNLWDTLDDSFELSQIGLITAKSVMQLYLKPFRRLEGTIKAKDASFDSRYTFDAIPGRLFILQRGIFNNKEGYIEDATFVEIENLDVSGGGTIGGEDLDPVWIPTGRTRCQKDMGNLNTGVVEIQERDINQNSETFGQIRWVAGQTDTTVCPVDQPSKYYFGTEPGSYSVSNFLDFPFLQLNNEVNIIYDNIGGNFIYFLHLSSLGVVTGIQTETQTEIISDFQYLADVTIDGFLYRVLRQNFVTADFNDFNVIYKFN